MLQVNVSGSLTDREDEETSQAQETIYLDASCDGEQCSQKHKGGACEEVSDRKGNN